MLLDYSSEIMFGILCLLALHSLYDKLFKRHETAKVDLMEAYCQVEVSKRYRGRM